MGPNRKSLTPADVFVADELKRHFDDSGHTLRSLAALTGISYSRLGKVFRHETPPASIGEIVAIAAVFGIRGSDVIAGAEALVSDLDPTMYALAARADDDDDEAAAQQIDP